MFSPSLLVPQVELRLRGIKNVFKTVVEIEEKFLYQSIQSQKKFIYTIIKNNPKDLISNVN